MEKLISKYLSDTATLEEKQKLLEWLREDSNHPKLFRDIQQIWYSSNNIFLREVEINRAIELFKKRAAKYEEKKKRMNKLLFYRISVAASLLIAIFSTGGFLLGKSMKSANIQEKIVNNVIMGKDSKGNVALPDGTIVWLNAGSKLVYPEKFSEEARIVKLEGEGYFDVTPNPKVPFYVETDKMKVRVLGTQFDLKNYPGRSSMETVLLSGKVEVIFNNSKNVILQPNQKISIHKETGEHAIEEFNAQNQVLWTNEQLVLSDKKLSEVLQSIGFWYGVNVTSEESIDLNQRLSLTIRKESKEEILELLSLIIPIKYEIGTEEIIVRSKYPKVNP